VPALFPNPYIRRRGNIIGRKRVLDRAAYSMSGPITVVASATEWRHATRFDRLTKEAKHMSHQQPAGVSRRSIVKGGVYALTGIAIASVTRTRVSAAETKLAKSAVQYVDAGKEEGKDCDDCIQFIPGKTAKALGTCRIVEGEINPHGHCIAFTPKPKS